MGARTIALLAVAAAMALPPATASARTCKGTWQTGGAVQITFLKNSRIRYCTSGTCEAVPYREAIVKEAIQFRGGKPPISVVVSWIQGRYLISRKASPTARTVYASLDCDS